MCFASFISPQCKLFYLENGGSKFLWRKLYLRAEIRCQFLYHLLTFTAVVTSNVITSKYPLYYALKLFRFYLLTPWSTVLLEKLTGYAASQEIPCIFGTRKFFTVLTSARHLSLSWANSIQSPQLPPTSWRSILILPSCLCPGLPSCLFPSGFPTRTLCKTLLSPICATCPSQLIHLDFITRTILGKE